MWLRPAVLCLSEGLSSSLEMLGLNCKVVFKEGGTSKFLVLLFD